jgi:hypothetical protein
LLLRKTVSKRIEVAVHSFERKSISGIKYLISFGVEIYWVSHVSINISPRGHDGALHKDGSHKTKGRYNLHDKNLSGFFVGFFD